MISKEDFENGFLQLTVTARVVHLHLLLAERDGIIFTRYVHVAPQKFTCLADVSV